MQVTLITVGKNKDKALQKLIDEYLKRITVPLKIIELTPPTCSDAERKKREAESIRKILPARSIVIVLDEKGRDMTSVALANHLQEYYTSPSGQSLSFIIGGADGLDDSIIQSAQLHLSFGKQTWPHMMVRLMLVEQLYRIQTILTGHPYHRV